MPVVLRTVVKPTPSIYKVQQTVDYAAKRNATLQINGRHDPCIVHRARVVQDLSLIHISASWKAVDRAAASMGRMEKVGSAVQSRVLSSEAMMRSRT